MILQEDTIQSYHITKLSKKQPKNLKPKTMVGLELPVLLATQCHTVKSHHRFIDRKLLGTWNKLDGEKKPLFMAFSTLSVEKEWKPQSILESSSQRTGSLVQIHMYMPLTSPWLRLILNCTVNSQLADFIFHVIPQQSSQCLDSILRNPRHPWFPTPHPQMSNRDSLSTLCKEVIRTSEEVYWIRPRRKILLASILHNSSQP